MGWDTMWASLARIHLNNTRAKSSFRTVDIRIQRKQDNDHQKLQSSGCAAQHIFIEILVQYCTVGMLHVIHLSYTKVGILIKTFIKMLILKVKWIYQWYIKAMKNLLNGQKLWLDSGDLNCSSGGEQEGFIARNKNWLLETIIKNTIG